MPQVILAVGIKPYALKLFDELGTDNYLIIVCKTKAKDAGMNDDYFLNTFTYIEANPERFDSVSQDILRILSLCNPPREKVDILIMDDFDQDGVDENNLFARYKDLLKEDGTTLFIAL
jgi:hypothetical protein